MRAQAAARDRAAHRPVAPLQLVTTHLSAGTTQYRVVPLTDPQKPGTAHWTVERRFVARAGEPMVIQVMVFTIPGQTTIDTLLFQRRTLLPLWEHVHGATTMMLDFAGTHVTGRMAHQDSAARAIDLTASTPIFSTTIDETVVQSLPLTRGYQVILPFAIGAGIEYDTARVQRIERVHTPYGPRVAWVVDLAEPGSTETLWIDRATRHILRHTIEHKDHSHRELITEGAAGEQPSPPPRNRR